MRVPIPHNFDSDSDANSNAMDKNNLHRLKPDLVETSESKGIAISLSQNLANLYVLFGRISSLSQTLRREMSYTEQSIIFLRFHPMKQQPRRLIQFQVMSTCQFRS
jgi:hypothetical protein